MKMTKSVLIQGPRPIPVVVVALCMMTSIVRLLVATLHVGMTRFQDGGYTQLAQLQRDYLRWVKISFTH